MSIHCIKIHCIKNHGISGTYRFEEQTRRGMTCVCSSKKPPNCWIYFKTRSNHKSDRIANPIGYSSATLTYTFNALVSSTRSRIISLY
jgi:hypothetical protein